MSNVQTIFYYKQAFKKDKRIFIYGLLILTLALTWGYILYDKSKTTQTIQHTQIHDNSIAHEKR